MTNGKNCDVSADSAKWNVQFHMANNNNNNNKQIHVHV